MTKRRKKTKELADKHLSQSQTADVDLSQKTDYRFVSQNRALEQWAALDDKTDIVKDENGNPDITLGRETLKTGEIQAFIKSTDRLGVSEQQTDLYIKATLREQPNHQNKPNVYIFMDKYMKDRGLKVKAKARKHLSKELRILKNQSVTYTGAKDSKDPTNQDFDDLSFISEIHHHKNGPLGEYYDVVLSPTYHKMLTTNQTMPMAYSPLLLLLNPKTENSSYRILKALNKNKGLNLDTYRENMMTVKTLLKKCKRIPSYEKVMSGNGNVTKRIIDPFFKAVERLASPADGDIADYNYIDGHGHVIKEKDYESLTYKQFINLRLVIVKWRRPYPREQVRKWKKTRQKYIKKAIKQHNRKARKRK